MPEEDRVIKRCVVLPAIAVYCAQALAGAAAADCAQAGVYDPRSTAVARGPLPRYEDHSVKERFAGRPAVPDLKSAPGAKRFAAVIREGAEKGPDFAGHYTVVLWGCGSGCQSFVIVDAKSGAIYAPRFGSESGVCYRPDSSLLIVDPISEDLLVDGAAPERLKTKYYVWDGNKLNLVTESRSVMKDEQCR